MTTAVLALTPGSIDVMLLIPCPWCGPRDQCEFDYGGANVKFPDLRHSPETSIDDWHKAVHLRENAKGEIREIWYHRSGCERWISITRNSLTHEFSEPSAGDEEESSRNCDAD